jgi:phage terminase large subunit
MPFPSTRTPEERAQIKKDKLAKSVKFQRKRQLSAQSKFLDRERAKLEKRARKEFVEEQKKKASAELEISQTSAAAPVVEDKPAELQVTIPAAGWCLRDYQRPAWEYLEGGGKRAVLNWHRRAGKDLFAINRIAWEMTRRPGLYWHVFPTYNQGRKIVWEGYRNDGVPFLSAFPKPIIYSEHNVDMRLSLSIGSTYQVVGADNPDSLVGANPIGIVFSEFALMDNAETVWNFLEPMLLANGGWAMFISTPRGRNFFHTLFDLAGRDPEQFRERLTINDTKTPEGKPVVSEADIQKMRDRGTDEAIIQQEFFGSFTAPLSGSYYGSLLDRSDKEGRIRPEIPYEPSLPVHTAWDLGIRDSTSIIFFQSRNAEIRIIDAYQSSGEALPHYIKHLNQLPYVYGKHFAPHDITVRELTHGKSRLEVARTLGVKFSICPLHKIQDGIEAARNILPQCYFSAGKVGKLMEALRGYRKRFNQDTQEFSAEPVHDKFSHYADAFRVLAFSHRPDQSSGFGADRQVQMSSHPGYDFGIL